MAGPLAGQVVVVTGASRGIGKGLALGLAALGASVVCAARTVTEEPGGLPGTIHTTVGAHSAPANGAKAQSAEEAVRTMTRQIVSNTLNDLSQDLAKR